MLVVATIFGSNHIAARIAFDHGVDVTTAVAVRSGITALAVLALLLAYRVPLRLPGATLGRGLAIGAILTVQSYCLYSSVARIPVALALLAFNTHPMMLSLIARVRSTRMMRPPRRAARPALDPVCPGTA